MKPLSAEGYNKVRGEIRGAVGPLCDALCMLEASAHPDPAHIAEARTLLWQLQVRQKQATLQRNATLKAERPGFKAASAQSDGSLILRGLAATLSVDRDAEQFTPQALEKAIPGYLACPMVLLAHDPEKVIGNVRSATLTADGVYVEAVVPPPPPGSEPWLVQAFDAIKRGVYRAFSVGGRMTKLRQQIVGMDWMETSVVSIPAQPGALYRVYEKAYAAKGATATQVIGWKGTQP